MKIGFRQSHRQSETRDNVGARFGFVAPDDRTRIIERATREGRHSPKVYRICAGCRQPCDGYWDADLQLCRGCAPADDKRRED